MMFQLSFTRIVTVYIAQSFMVAVAIGLSYFLLKNKEDRNRRKFIFSFFYILSAIGLIINYIYAPLNDPIILKILYAITLYCIYNGSVLISLFVILFHASWKGKEINTRLQIGYILLYAFLFSFIFFIPSIHFGEYTNWKPTVELPLYIYVMLIHISLIITLSIYSVKILRIFRKGAEELSIYLKRWIAFIIGWICIFLFMDDTLTMNLLNNETIRTIFTFPNAILSFIGSFLLYALFRRFKKKK